MFVSSLRAVVFDRWLIKLQAARVGILQCGTMSHLLLVLSIHADIFGLAMHDIYCRFSTVYQLQLINEAHKMNSKYFSFKCSIYTL